MATEFVVNEAIKASQIRVVDNNGDQLGVMDTRSALSKARQLNLDLVVISDKSIPWVAKILDFSKFKYEQSKKERERLRKQRENQVEVKEIRLRPVTNEHDKQVKIKQIQRFISEGNKVKITVKFSGREISHDKLGYDMLNSIIGSVSGSKVEQPITRSDKSIFVTLGSESAKT